MRVPDFQSNEIDDGLLVLTTRNSSWKRRGGALLQQILDSPPAPSRQRKSGKRDQMWMIGRFGVGHLASGSVDPDHRTLDSRFLMRTTLTFRFQMKITRRALYWFGPKEQFDGGPMNIRWNGHGQRVAGGIRIQLVVTIWGTLNSFSYYNKGK